MKLSDIGDLNKDDVLSALGLSAKPSTSERWLGVAGIFGAGLLVGAGIALLLAPKSGEGLREELGARLRRARNGDAAASEPSEESDAAEEART